MRAPRDACVVTVACLTRQFREESFEVVVRRSMPNLPENAKHTDIVAQPWRSEVEVKIRLALPNLEVFQERRLNGV